MRGSGLGTKSNVGAQPTPNARTHQSYVHVNVREMWVQKCQERQFLHTEQRGRIEYELQISSEPKKCHFCNPGARTRVGALARLATPLNPPLLILWRLEGHRLFRSVKVSPDSYLSSV